MYARGRHSLLGRVWVSGCGGCWGVRFVGIRRGCLYRACLQGVCDRLGSVAMGRAGRREGLLTSAAAGGRRRDGGTVVGGWGRWWEGVEARESAGRLKSCGVAKGG